MPASSPPSPTVRRPAATVLALGLAGAALAGAPAAYAAPGDNGDVKIHNLGTPFTGQLDETKVCGFYLAGFNFDKGQSVTWSIQTQPLRAGGATLNGTLSLPTGTDHTLPLSLPDGQYKLTWKITGGNGAGKQKVFKVDCRPIAIPPGGASGGSTGGGNGGPNGGPNAGGGGLAGTDGFTDGVPPAAGIAALGLVGVSGVLFVRRLRRRSHGAA
ncbi:hypothetical protein [Streptomyces sp. BPTC-684]|uniref:hypothetical protein n=1 Tax=Streptomyces sp. BPTC-684 TaxID=3043734 RepID=UPI0024B1FF97|nr:hypothetical protein [Streptomyces sp. BPTC-684]WHM39471.1 hypothetical protein QIY60_23335 [Streptomyces sp. BPTC-684]